MEVEKEKEKDLDFRTLTGKEKEKELDRTVTFVDCLDTLLATAQLDRDNETWT